MSEACRLAGTANVEEGTAERGLARLAFAFRLQDCPRHFLNKQGNAVRALGNVLPNTLRQRRIACKTRR